MNEAGLPEKWRSRFRKGNRCTGKEKKKPPTRHQSANHRITLKNLSGSFVVFLVGISFSIAIFIIELILRRRNRSSKVVPIQPPAASAAVVVPNKPRPIDKNVPARRRIINPKVAKIQPMIRLGNDLALEINNLPQVQEASTVVIEPLNDAIVNNPPPAAGTSVDTKLVVAIPPPNKTAEVVIVPLNSDVINGSQSIDAATAVVIIPPTPTAAVAAVVINNPIKASAECNDANAAAINRSLLLVKENKKTKVASPQVNTKGTVIVIESEPDSESSNCVTGTPPTNSSIKSNVVKEKKSI